MFVLRLIVSIDGLGSEGNQVVVDPEKVPTEDDWVLTQVAEGLRFCPFEEGLLHSGTVLGVIP